MAGSSSSKQDELNLLDDEGQSGQKYDEAEYMARFMSNLPNDQLSLYENEICVGIEHVEVGTIDTLEEDLDFNSPDALRILRDIGRGILDDKNETSVTRPSNFFAKLEESTIRKRLENGIGEGMTVEQTINRALAEGGYHPSSSTPSSSVYTYNALMEDVKLLYARGLESHFCGRFREVFNFLRPALPFLATNPLAWIRMSEACIYELYEDVWNFYDLYERLFANKEQNFMPSPRRQMNELRQRNLDMSLKFAECATSLALVMSKQSKVPVLHLYSAQNHIFMMLKLRKYQDALDTISWVIMKSAKEQINTNQMALFLLYKAEAVLFMGQWNRAIQYATRVNHEDIPPKMKVRAEMICAMGYLKKENFVKAYENVMNILNIHLLDEEMLENVALFGVDLSHRLQSVEMLQRFLELLQEAVY